MVGSEADCMWRVERRRLEDLSLVDVYRSNPSEVDEWAYGIGVNPITGDLWVIGFDWVDELQKWRVEILSKDLSSIKTIRLNVSSSRIFKS